MNVSFDTKPEWYFLKYKGIPSIPEILHQSKRIGFKCKKYANWTDVHATANSKAILKTIGDALIDTSTFPAQHYIEFSMVWEKVQRWTKDRDRLSLEPDLLPEFEKLSRIITSGAKNPNIVDIVINEFGFDVAKFEIKERWLVFQSICIFNFFSSSKRYDDLITEKISLADCIKNSKIFLLETKMRVEKLFNELDLNAIKKSSLDPINIFSEGLGLISSPINTSRDDQGLKTRLDTVWVEKYQGERSRLVEFSFVAGEMIVKVNQAHKVFGDDTEISRLLSNELYWQAVGSSLLSNIGQLDNIQDFFDTFGKKLRFA
jgi:hypothetical protein